MTSVSEQNISPRVKTLIFELYEIGAIKFGSFKLKSGIISPIYIDLRVAISYPKVLNLIAVAMNDLIKTTKFDVMCGVPYTGVFFATSIAIQNNAPLIMCRKEGKRDCGTKKAIEGAFKNGDKCLVVEDVITSGESTKETVNALQSVNICVSDVVTVIDREQGGKENLQREGLHIRSLITLTEILNVLEDAQKIESSLVENIKTFIRSNQLVKKKEEKSKGLTFSYEDRIKYCKNVTGRKLFRIMQEKKSNLCVAADVTTKASLFRLIKEVGPYICMLKTHIDILEDFSPDVIPKLKYFAKKYNFLLFEDRKYGDIGYTAMLQFNKGLYKVSRWADFVTVNMLPGPGIIQGLKEGYQGSLILVAEMSTTNNFADTLYTTKCKELAEENEDSIAGLITQNTISSHPGIIHMTPGIKLKDGSDTCPLTSNFSKTDELGQTYDTPEKAIERGTDVIIIGRGITMASLVSDQAKMYRDIGWNAYEKRIRHVRPQQESPQTFPMFSKL